MLIAISAGILILCCGIVLGGLFAFHCGYIYGRFGISAYEYHKLLRRAAQQERGSA